MLQGTGRTFPNRIFLADPGRFGCCRNPSKLLIRDY